MVMILIPCSDKKTPGGTSVYDASTSIYSMLPPELRERLLACRAELAALAGLPLGPDFGNNQRPAIEYLPACERYRGKLYRAANITIDDIKRWPEKRVVIMSALYGMLLPEEMIRDYDLSMSTGLVSGIRASTWWRRHRLGEIVSQVAKHLNATNTYDLLSEDYRSALSPWPRSGYAPNYKKPEFGKLGQGINFYRGRDLRRVLTENKTA